MSVALQFVSSWVVIRKVILFPEVLPAVTHHRTEGVLVAKCLVIIGKCIEQEVALVLHAALHQSGAILLVFGVHGARKVGNILVVLTFEYVVAKVDVQLQVFEPMHLVSNGSTTYRTHHFIVLVGQFELCNGIVGLYCHGRTAVGPDEVAKSRVGGRCRAAGHYRACWIVTQCSTHHRVVDHLIVLIRHFQIKVGREVVVKERRGNVAAKRKTLVIIGFDDTILVSVAERHTERGFNGFYLARHRNILLRAECGTIYLILPIGICRTELRICRHTCHGGNKCFKFIGSQHIEAVGRGAYRIAARIIYSQAVATFLGGDNNHTIRCTRTVDGGSRSIFQHGERFNIIGID